MSTKARTLRFVYMRHRVTLTKDRAPLQTLALNRKYLWIFRIVPVAFVKVRKISKNLCHCAMITEEFAYSKLKLKATTNWLEFVRFLFS